MIASGRVLRLQQNRFRVVQRSQRSQRARFGTATAEANGSAKGVKISFRVPYRCSFGQQVYLVGESEEFGHWDVPHGVRLEWNEGDEWTGAISVHDTNASIKYKYVVVNQDGKIHSWQPGNDVQLQLPGVINLRSIQVVDSWAQNYQDVTIDETEASNGPSQTEEFQQEEYQEEVFQEEEYQPSLGPDLHLSTVDRAFQELDETVSRCVMLQEQGEMEPDSFEALQADREVAAAAERAIALQKAWQQVSDSSKQLPESGSSEPGASADQLL